MSLFRALHTPCLFVSWCNIYLTCHQVFTKHRVSDFHRSRALRCPIFLKAVIHPLFLKGLIHSFTEAYLEPSIRSAIEDFAVDYFCKKVPSQMLE